MKTILAPVDFSAISDAVIDQAAVLATALDGRVVLFAVVQPPVITHEYAALMENIEEITAAGEKNAERQLARAESALSARSVPVESSLRVGSPIPLIVEQAAAVQADYIVMGSHGHTALYDLLVGSTTHGVLMRAGCPVVIVPAPKSADDKRKK